LQGRFSRRTAIVQAAGGAVDFMNGCELPIRQPRHVLPNLSNLVFVELI
jgi:hypothetical protein